MPLCLIYHPFIKKHLLNSNCGSITFADTQDKMLNPELIFTMTDLQLAAADRHESNSIDVQLCLRHSVTERELVL